MFRPLFIVFLLAFMIFSSGCTRIIGATTDEPLQIDPGKRSFGEYIDDNQIHTVITVNINKANPTLNKSRVHVHVFNGVVLLTGQVPTHDLRDLVGNTARKVNTVRQVYNEIGVGPKIGFGKRTEDNWIHSKIKSKLVFNKDIDSDRVEVIVENNVVYLMGKLTHIQAEKITEVVRTTKGVLKVVRAIEYID